MIAFCTPRSVIRLGQRFTSQPTAGGAFTCQTSLQEPRLSSSSWANELAIRSQQRCCGLARYARPAPRRGGGKPSGNTRLNQKSSTRGTPAGAASWDRHCMVVTPPHLGRLCKCEICLILKLLCKSSVCTVHET